MSATSQDTDGQVGKEAVAAGGASASREPRPPAKRPFAADVIEISDTDSDDSDVCAVISYQASADEVKRIRGADYSCSSSQSSEYSSDSESPCEDDSVVLHDDRPAGAPARMQLNPRANRMDDPLINLKIKEQDLLEKLMSHWKERKDYKSEAVSVTCEPYRVCVVRELLANPNIINNIVDDMNTLDWSRKRMDLYEFHQTADLASLTWQRSIRGIYDLLKTDVMTWVAQVTGLELRSVSASCSLYGPGDHLLTHDDMLADRRVAFILYLAPWRPPASRHRENGAAHQHQETGGWSPRMGGALELLARDELGQPGAVARTIYPNNNTLVLFQVGPETFHQVAEVLSLDLPRLSINGWFHGPAPAAEPEPPAPEEPPEPELDYQKPHMEIVLMNQWVEPTYLSPRSRAQVQAQMERASEVCLRSLLLPARCAELLDALHLPEVSWESCGPSNRRRYERVAGEWARALDASHPVRALLRLVSGVAWFRLLADCTGLALSGCCEPELQRWAPGHYTLLPPRRRYEEARLEATLYLGAPARPLPGAGTSYVAPEEPDAAALVTLTPAHNSLNLVYCEPGTASFTKYFSRLNVPPDTHFYILTCTYKE